MIDVVGSAIVALVITLVALVLVVRFSALILRVAAVVVVSSVVGVFIFIGFVLAQVLHG